MGGQSPGLIGCWVHTTCALCTVGLRVTHWASADTNCKGEHFILQLQNGVAKCTIYILYFTCKKAVICWHKHTFLRGASDGGWDSMCPSAQSDALSPGPAAATMLHTHNLHAQTHAHKQVIAQDSMGPSAQSDALLPRPAATCALCIAHVHTDKPSK